MKELLDWPFNWFGFWAEYGEAYCNCPSIRLFISPEENNKYPIERLRSYLTIAPAIAATSRFNFPHPITGERTGGAISFRSDGKWLWLDDLADYIHYDKVAIPHRWLADIEANNFVPLSSITENQLSALQWPPVKR